VLKLPPYLALATVVVGPAWLGCRSIEGRRQVRAGLLARADQQHRWVMRGDERGVYGP
jgi:hypothetical protein